MGRTNIEGKSMEEYVSDLRETDLSREREFENSGRGRCDGGRSGGRRQCKVLVAGWER